MTLRYLAVVLLLTAIGAGLLGLRRQQLNDKHAMAESHTQLKRDRELIKDMQVRIARRTTPEALRAAIDRAGLVLEPITRSSAQNDRPDDTSDAPRNPTPADNPANDG